MRTFSGRTDPRRGWKSLRLLLRLRRDLADQREAGENFICLGSLGDFVGQPDQYGFWRKRFRRAVLREPGADYGHAGKNWAQRSAVGESKINRSRKNARTAALFFAGGLQFS